MSHFRFPTTRRAIGFALGLLLAASPAAADDPVLVCFGNEPSWGLSLERPGEARLDLPDASPVTFRGGASALPAGERIWRGRAESGAGDLVAFLRDAPCSDTMSDVRHPVTARVSLPDGRALAGCCRIPGDAMAATKGEGDAARAASFEGTTWRLTRLPGHDAAFLAAVPDGVTVRFAARTVQAFAGCNRMSGGYTVDGDRLTFGPLAGTMMACPPPIGEVETAVGRALSGTRRIALDGDTLTLVADDGSELAFAHVPPARLDGSGWTVTGFNNGRQAVVSPLPDTVLTLAFRDGVVSGHAGCNTFRATYTVDGDRLAIGRAATTRKACPGEGVMEQERQYVAALESVTTWSIERGLLDLHRGDGERALTAKRSEPAPGS